MTSHTKASVDVASCHFLLQGQAKILADRLYGPDGPPVGTSFSHLEHLALAVSGNLRKFLLDLLLEKPQRA